MKTVHSRNLSGVALVALSLIWAMPANAQAVVGPADAGRVTVPSRTPELTQMPQDIIKTEQAPAVTAPAGAEKVMLTLKDVTLEGQTIYTPEQLQSFYSGKIDQRISLADVFGIASALTAKYRNDGYILTQVVVPPQTIQSGHVRLQVIEGVVDAISIEGVTSEGELKAITAYANQVKGKPLNTADLERAVLLINDLPGVSVRSILSPSATVPGASDLKIIVDRKSYDGQVAVDNYGSRYLGRFETFAAASLNSIFGQNERVTASVAYVPHDGIEKELAYGDLTYTMPIGSYGTHIELGGALTSTNPGYTLEPLKVNGQSITASAKISHPVIRTRNTNWTVFGLMDMHHVTTQSNIDETREDRITALRIGSRYEVLDTFLGGGYNVISAEAAKGLSILGASDRETPNLSRTDGNPRFTKIEGEYQRLQRIVPHLNLLIGLKGQASDSPLLSSEEFGVGGSGYGRGYDPSEILGDSGIAGKLELQLTSPYEIEHIRTYQLYTFLDAGRVWNRDATTSADRQIEVVSTGLGVRVTLPSETKMGGYVAVPLNRDVGAEGNQDPRFYFNLNQSF